MATAMDKAISYDKRVVGLLMDYMGDLNSGRFGRHTAAQARYEYRTVVWNIENEILGDGIVMSNDIAYNLAMGACHQFWKFMDEF